VGGPGDVPDWKGPAFFLDHGGSKLIPSGARFQWFSRFFPSVWQTQVVDDSRRGWR
jgi:hypothetical protein